MTKLPQRPRPHILEAESRKFVKNILPAEWIIEDGQSDYGIDLVVEIVETANVTGAHFLMQLKATDNVKKRKGDFISHSCRSSTLRYFLERPEPIIYLLYDASTKQGYWIWIQDYIRNHLAENWKNQTTTTIRIPKANLLNEKIVKQIKTRVLRSHNQAKLLSTVQTFNNPFVRYEMKTDGNTDTITAFSKYPGADEDNPIYFDLKFKFDKSTEGQQAYQSLQSTLKKGTPAEIDGRFIEDFKFPELFNPEIFGVNVGKFEKLFIKPIKSGRKFATKIEILGKDEKTIAQMPFVEFKDEYIGSEEVFVTNEEQQLPIKISMRFNLVERIANISFRFDFERLNVYQVKETLKIQEAFARGSWIHITDIKTNTTLVKDAIRPNAISMPSKKLLDIAEKLALIQERTGHVLLWPSQIITSEMNMINKIVTIINTGKSLEGNYCEFKLNKADAREWAKAFAKHGRLNIQQKLKNRVVTLFGQDIQLGPATLIMPVAMPNEETIKRFASIDELPADAAIQIELDVDDPGVTIVFHRWRSNSQTDQ
jgi:hypothetical protein